MKEEKTTYKCDRCKKEIGKLIFWFKHGTGKISMTAETYEIAKYGYLPSDKVPLPNEECMVLDIILGYSPLNYKTIHLCSKCKKDFKKFMDLKE